MSESVVDQAIRESLHAKHNERRERIATACLEAIISWRGTHPAMSQDNAWLAVDAADALIAVLKEADKSGSG